ncbi:MAG: tRNA (adenosine(37)-N6)-dimethylallyltransferase MiaA [Clostridiales bacterium]|nr:tRNA (adenosine(37)-N6)-dimethylallyltransferase MiaA [Clostridiales bacterium]
MKDLKEYNVKYSYIPIIAGPTASGKSSLAIELAKRIDGEVISCDSMQIYKGLDIGTAKVTKDEIQMIPHHMIDIVEPEVTFSVSDFITMAYDIIEDILSRGKMPILCGGTGQYISAFYEGIKYVDQPIDQALVDKLYKQAESEGIDEIYEALEEVDPEAASKIHKNNTRRVIRAYAVYLSTGKTFTWWNENSKKDGPKYPYKLFTLDYDRNIIYDRINKRVDVMVKDGLVDEVKSIYESYNLKESTAIQALGYKEIIEYLDGNISLDEAIYQIKLRSRHYAKRQLTWFRYMENREIIDINDVNATLNYIMDKII